MQKESIPTWSLRRKSFAKPAVVLLLQESRRITFESTLDQSAVLMAEAQMLDAAAKDGKAFAGKDLTEVFKAQTENRPRLTHLM